MPTLGRLVNPYQFMGTDIFGWITDSADGEGYVQTEPVRYRLPKAFEGVAYALRTGDSLRLANEELAILQGMLWVPQGYCFDGASGPAIDGVRNLLAALLHDALCDMLRAGCKDYTQKQADKVYRAVMIAQKAGWFRASYHYVGLRLYDNTIRRFKEATK